MTEAKLNINLDKLAKMRKQLGTELIARVGVLGADATASHKESVTRYDTQTGKPYKAEISGGSDLTNGELAMVHEFGSVSRNIPIRSFLRMPLMEKSKDIVKMLATKEIKAMIVAGQIATVFRLIGVKGENIVQRAFETQGFGHWPSVKPATAKEKGNTSMLGTAEGILIESGQLRRAVTSDVVKA